jgi:hypothetical protein
MVPESNATAVSGLLTSLRREGALSTHDEALGRVALTLARALDDGAGMATAAVSKELRATLAALTSREEITDVEDAIFGADLSAPVRNTEES